MSVSSSEEAEEAVGSVGSPVDEAVESPVDELQGSQSRRWMSDIFAEHHVRDAAPDPNGNVSTEVCTTAPQFIVDGATRMDVCQGELGDCWFLSALASLSMHRTLLERVVPPGQGFQNGYDGSFYFRGGYQALQLGFPHEAMADMTGGVTEVVNVASLSRNLPHFLRHLLDKGALINCANCKVQTSKGPVHLVRLHNPWGNTEWEGPWSDLNGPEWNTVSLEEQRRLSRVDKNDGEFWMTVSDFRQNLEIIELCHLSDSLSLPGSAQRPWHCTMHQGTWKHAKRAGLHLALGLRVYKVRAPGTPLTPMDLSQLRPELSMPHIVRREVVLRGTLAPGHYVVIPFTAMPNQEGAFILRVLTEKGNTAIPADRPGTTNISTLTEGYCKPRDLHQLISEALKGGVLEGTEKRLALEHCKSMVVLTDSQGLARLDWKGFKTLWHNIQKWTDVFLSFDKNGSKRLEYAEVTPALKSAGIHVDDFIMQLVGLRYTEPDMTISYPGFLFLMVKLDSMIQKFHAYDVTGLGAVSVSFRQWLHLTMYS
ncbi:hypothetical protein CRUP_009659 [Coryphaenoides rupestris]|nr:hypothetical protein CRUP_009659 [Coryphaenoides rupestris]